MKNIILPVIMLFAVITTVVVVGITANRSLNDFCALVDRSVPQSAEEAETIMIGINNILAEYDKLKPFMILFICERDICETEALLEDMKSSATTNDYSGVITAKNRLILHITQLKRLSVFSFEAIF